MKRKDEEARMKEIELAREYERAMLLDVNDEEKKLKDMDPSKRALIERFGYDESEKYDESGNFVSEVTDKPSTSSSDINQNEHQSVNNRANSQKLNKENAQNLRSAQNQSKKDERAKTKAAKLEKMNKKEERRKRAMKSERKR